MNEFLTYFHFLRPWWLIALLPLACLVWQLRYKKQSLKNWQDVCDPHLLNYLIVDLNKQTRQWLLTLIALAWLICVIALAGPSWKKLPLPVYKKTDSLVLVLDLSATMLAEDIPPSRLERAKFKLLDILQERKEGLTALLVFTREPFVVSPLTDDSNTIANLVPVLTPTIMPVLGYDLNTALLQAQNLLTQAQQAQGEVLVLTSGDADNKSVATAEKLKQQGFSVSVLGIGTEEGSPITLPDGSFLQNQQGSIIVSKLAQTSLQKLANAGGGRYATFSNNNYDIQILLSQQLKTAKQEEIEEQLSEQWRDEGPWLVFLLLPFGLLAFRRGWLGDET